MRLRMGAGLYSSTLLLLAAAWTARYLAAGASSEYPDGIEINNSIMLLGKFDWEVSTGESQRLAALMTYDVHSPWPFYPISCFLYASKELIQLQVYAFIVQV